MRKVANKIRALILLAALFVVVACGDDSGNNSKTDEKTDKDKITAIPQVESFDDLPNCSKNREDSIMVALDENIAYICSDKHWDALGELHETEDALPNCSGKRDGIVAYILETKEKVICSDGSWDELSSDDSVKSSSSKKESDSKKSSDSKGNEISSSKEGDSSSSSKDADNSSSSKINGTSSDSELNVGEITCENAPYTTQTAGPIGKWGAFGYVVPMKITTSKIQELYLAFDTTDTRINGPDGWSSFGVLVAQYDSEKNQWIPGTEIFSSEHVKSATTDGGNYGNVNTYGIFEKFSFDIKGSWLEKYSGKTVDVVVNFYAPGVKSDSSGMGLDFYSIPSDESGNAYQKLYYSGKKMDCILPIKLRLSNNPCFVSAYKVYQGDTVVWSIPVTSKMANLYWFSASSVAGEIVKISDNELSSSQASIYVVYPKKGVFSEKLSYTPFPGIKQECKAEPGWQRSYGYSDTLEVFTPPAKKCICKASAEKVDAATAGNFTLSVGGCSSEIPIADYTWGHTICTETKTGGVCRDTTKWSQASKITESSVSVSFKSGERTNYSPFVIVTNEEGSSSKFTCPDISVKPLTISSNEIIPNKRIEIPVGTYPVQFVLPEQEWSCATTLSCSAYSGNALMEIKMNDKIISKEIDYYEDVRLSEELSCPSSVAATITVSDDVYCELAQR